VEIPEWLCGHRLGELLEAVTAREAEKRDVSVEALIEALDAILGGGELPVAPEESKAPPPLSEQGERRHLTGGSSRGPSTTWSRPSVSTTSKSMRPLRTRWGLTTASFPAPMQPGLTSSSAIPTGGSR